MKSDLTTALKREAVDDILPSIFLVKGETFQITHETEKEF